MLQKTLSVITIFICCFSATAQNKIWKNVTIRKAFESNTSDDKKGAVVSYTSPKDSAASFLVNAGLGFTWPYADDTKNHTNHYTGFFVYNRNTLVDATQKNYKVGVAINSKFDISQKPSFLVFGTTALQYLHDYVDTSHSAILTSYWHPVYKAKNCLHIGGYQANPHRLDYFFIPSAGVEYQNIIDANSTFKKGYDARFYFDAGLNIRLKKKSFRDAKTLKDDLKDSLAQDTTWLKKTLAEVNKYADSVIPSKTKIEQPKNFWPKVLEFSFHYTGRASVVNNNSNFDKYIPLFVCSANFYPFKSEDIYMSVSYNNGANPIDGTLKQTFWLFSINFLK